MLSTLPRTGPLLTFAAGLVTAVVLFVLAGGPFAPANPWISEYEPVEKAGLWSLGTGGAMGAAWYARRARRRAAGRFMGLALAAVWLVVGGALAVDILYAVFGPGIPTVVNCGSGMDCIGKPRPQAPLLGSAEVVVLYLVLTTPALLIGLFVSTIRQPGSEPVR